MTPRRPKLRRAVRLLTATALTAGLTLGPAAAAAATELGIDVSRWQHSSSLDWAAVRADGVTFAFVKATEGSTYVNPYFAGDWEATRGVGILHGAYHFARPSVGTAAAQARHFVATAGNHDQVGDLPPVLDLEATGGLTVPELRAWTQHWLTTVEGLTGRVPIIYTSPAFWETHLGNSTAFTRYPLWIAHYNVTAPRVPGGWPGWTFWQSTSKGRVQGIAGDVDVNAFNGTRSQLEVLAQVPQVKAGLALSRAAAYPKEPVSVDGTLTAATGEPLAGRQVLLQRRSATVPAWTTIATLTTDAAGAWSWPTQIGETADFRAVFPGTATEAGVESAVQTLTLRPRRFTRVTLQARRPTVRRGGSVPLEGRLRTGAGAALTGETVTLLARRAGTSTWRQVATARARGDLGTFRIRVAPRRTTHYRVVYAGGVAYQRARSLPEPVSVR